MNENILIGYLNSFSAWILHVIQAAVELAWDLPLQKKLLNCITEQ